MQANEYFYLLKDTELLSLIVQVTGSEAKSPLAKLTLSTINHLKAFADFTKGGAQSREKSQEETAASLSTVTVQQKNGDATRASSAEQSFGMNLSYTINLNLPATSDQAVFNAIFKSIKEHLLINE